MTTIQIKYSLTAGHVPTGLVYGELAINLVDQILFYLDDDGVTIDQFNFAAPQGPTMGAGDSSAHLANTNFVTGALNSLLATIMGSPSPPSTLNSFSEVAAALGNSPTFATDTNNALANRLRFDAPQSLTSTQQAQIQTNIGITGPGAAIDGGTF